MKMIDRKDGWFLCRVFSGEFIPVETAVFLWTPELRRVLGAMGHMLSRGALPEPLVEGGYGLTVSYACLDRVVALYDSGYTRLLESYPGLPECPQDLGEDAWLLKGFSPGMVEDHKFSSSLVWRTDTARMVAASQPSGDVHWLIEFPSAYTDDRAFSVYLDLAGVRE